MSARRRRSSSPGHDRDPSHGCDPKMTRGPGARSAALAAAASPDPRPLPRRPVPPRPAPPQPRPRAPRPLPPEPRRPRTPRRTRLSLQGARRQASPLAPRTLGSCLPVEASAAREFAPASSDGRPGSLARLSGSSADRSRKSARQGDFRPIGACDLNGHLRGHLTVGQERVARRRTGTRPFPKRPGSAGRACRDERPRPLGHMSLTAPIPLEKRDRVGPAPRAPGKSR